MSEIERCKQDIKDIREQLRREHNKMLEDKRSRYRYIHVQSMLSVADALLWVYIVQCKPVLPCMLTTVLGTTETYAVH